MKSSTAKVVALSVAVVLVAVVGLNLRRVRQMARTSGVVSAAGAPAAAAVAQGGPSATRIRFVRNAKTLPEFSLPTFDGRTMSPATLRGKVVIINFWATWCGPCRAEIPSFIELQKKYADGLVILGVSEDETGQPGVEKFVADHQMNYPNVMFTRPLEKAFGGIVGLPTSFVVSREGRVVQKHVGLYSADTYEQEVRSLMGLPVNGTVELFDDQGQVSLENAAEATSIPGVDLDKLTPEQKRTALQRMNKEQCTCGCDRTLAQCRINDPSCATSLPLAQKVVAEIIKKRP